MSSSKNLSAIPEKRLALYGVATGAALAAGIPATTDAIPYTLDLRGLPAASRTTPVNGDLFFDVNAASAAVAVRAGAFFPGADFVIHNKSFIANSAQIYGLSGNGIAGGLAFSAGRYAASNFVGPANSFSTNRGIGFSLGPGKHLGNFGPGDTGYLGLRFTIGPDTFYGWAKIHLNGDYTVQLNALGYETTPNTAAHVEALSAIPAVPDQGSSIALLAIGAAGVLAFRRLQRNAA